MRESIRKEREKARRHKKALEHARKHHRQYMKKWDKKKSEANRKYHESINDTKGVYSIILAKDNHEIKKLMKVGQMWRSTAFDRFDKLVKENRDTLCSVKTTRDSDKVKYELLLLKKIDPNEDDGIRQFRDENDRLVDTFTDRIDFAIMKKEKWFLSETFVVYGYDPYNDKKSAEWVVENILLGKDNIKRIIPYKKNIIVMNDDDFDIIRIKSLDLRDELFYILKERCKEHPNLLFISTISEAFQKELKAKIIEKTGWTNVN